MRYIGNKDSILYKIREVIEKKNLIDKCETMFDAFSGTASVGNEFKKNFKIIANDNMYSAYVYSRGRLNFPKTNFSILGLDPFAFFNEEHLEKGFFYNNYSKGGSERMYFSEENAGKIDFIRSTIEDWKVHQKITDDEYYYLLACLMESISKVANVAGVYGSFLKTYDPRAVKPMKFIKIEANEESKSVNYVHNEKIENIIANIYCDILYLDPPYTKNQYSVQYHILETLMKYDNPELRGKTGCRDTSNLTSDWSKNGKVHLLFENIIKNTKAKYVLFSYSTDGLMSKEYIEAVLNRYAVPGTVELTKIPYKKYLNYKTESEGEHFEYIFYAELKDKELVEYNSPLNYIGGKGELVSFIKKNLPKNIDTFVDLFGGGFNVGINIKANRIIYNDCNFKVRELLEMFRDYDTIELYNFIEKNIKKYGLEKNNSETYINCRNDYNHPEPPKRDPKMLYLLILYGFQQQIRFNSKLEYNNPVGQSGFNDKILEKLVSFSNELKNKNVVFMSDLFTNLNSLINENNFFYCDPPYLITLGSYNDGKRGFNGWTEKDENELLAYLNEINRSGGKFMLSNVLKHKDKTNDILIKWVSDNGYRVIPYDGVQKKRREEVIIVNY